MLAKQQNMTVNAAITLPADQYAHEGAPSEWWWHIGTLESSDGRKFGFEINAVGKTSFAFTQIQITDIQSQRNYQKVNPIVPCPANWCQYDTSKPWFVKLLGSTENQNDGAVTMQAINGNPLNMTVEASFIDSTSDISCILSLHLCQEGSPLLVWGSGCHLVNPKGTTPLTRNNYYYSLTHLRATGSITIGDEVVQVTGLTWMDHEYGAFPGDLTWILQDIQLSNGLHLSNFTESGEVPKENVPMKSHATVLSLNGESSYVETTTTPMGPTFKSSKGLVYYLKFKVEVNSPELFATFIVDSLFPDQLFKDGDNSDIYEGVSEAHARFGNSDEIVFGTAWIEQNLG